MVLDSNSHQPLHVQAEEKLRSLISQEEYKNGKQLPSEVELSKQMGISRNTLRQAISKLVFEGLLVRKQRCGTKVVPKSIVTRSKNWLSFSQEMKRLGIDIRNYELHVSHRNPDGVVREFFGMKSDCKKQCVAMERVRGNREYPFVYFVSFFNPECPITGEEDFTRPLYEMLESDYNIVVKTSREEISARLAGEDIARKLDIEASDPIFIRRRFVYDSKGNPVEFNIGYYRADSFTYTVESIR